MRHLNLSRAVPAATSLPQGIAALALFAIAGCSGATGIEFAPPTNPTLVTLSTDSANITESGGLMGLNIVLSTGLPATPEDIVVEVVDTETGTATSGVDYEAIPNQIITFPAGSTDGTVEQITIRALTDALAEGADETLIIDLRAVGDAAVGPITSFTATFVDAQTASVSFESTDTITADESSNSYGINVALTVSAGAVLGYNATVPIQDMGSGAATPGSDYAAVTSAEVTFPTGSASGTNRSIQVQVLDDALAEGSESLSLSFGSGNIEATGILSHVITITDDESPLTPALVATTGVTGTETTVDSGDTVDLGIQVNGAGPNLGTLLRLTNQGMQGMQLGQPVLTGTDELDFAVEIETSSFGAEMGPQAFVAARPATADMASPFSLQPASVLPGQDPAPGIAVTVDEAILLDLALVDSVRLHGVPMPGMGEVTMELERIPLPIASDAVLMVDGVAVTGGPRALLGDLSTWRGTVAEIEDSRVFLALKSTGPEGFIELPYETGRFVHLSTETPPVGNAPATCRIVHEADLMALNPDARPRFCGGTEEVPGQSLDLNLDPDTAGFAPPTAGTFTTPVCRLALETDYQFFQSIGGGSSDVTDYVTGLVAALSDTYQTHIQTSLTIAYLGIHTTSDDGWSTPDTPGDTAAMLTEFRNAWTSSGWPATADLAHFLTPTNLGGGRAYVNVLCNQSFGFGVSGNLDTNINWGTWNGSAGSFTWDFVVVAHELGHNFGASHTHDYCPPIDQCSTNCNGSTNCSQGTIMSYCHACGGMDNIDIEFHPNIADIMRSNVEISCLGEAQMGFGDFVSYRVRFSPDSGTGSKTATLQFSHDAPNAPNPFEVVLTGTSQ